MLLKVMLVYSPVAVMSLLLTCTVISVDDGLLRTNTGCAGPSSSSTLYVDWLKLTETSIKVHDLYSIARTFHEYNLCVYQVTHVDKKVKNTCLK